MNQRDQETKCKWINQEVHWVGWTRSESACRNQGNHQIGVKDSSKLRSMHEAEHKLTPKSKAYEEAAQKKKNSDKDRDQPTETKIKIKKPEKKTRSRIGDYPIAESLYPSKGKKRKADKPEEFACGEFVTSSISRGAGEQSSHPPKPKVRTSPHPKS